MPKIYPNLKEVINIFNSKVLIHHKAAKTMPLETLRFDNYGLYFKWLLKTTDAPKAREIADHEKSHFEEARRRGYKVFYASQVLSSDPLIPFAHAVDFIGREPTAKDMVAICLAPKNPSIQDLKLAEKFQKNS